MHHYTLATIIYVQIIFSPLLQRRVFFGRLLRRKIIPECGFEELCNAMSPENNLPAGCVHAAWLELSFKYMKRGAYLCICMIYGKEGGCKVRETEKDG